MMKVTGSMLQNKKHFAVIEMKKQHQKENQQKAGNFTKQQTDNNFEGLTTNKYNVPVNNIVT